jgi:hypothetical protein
MNFAANPVAVTVLTFASINFPNIVESLRATFRRGKDFVGSKSKKMAVKMTDIIMYISCSEKMPCKFSSVFKGSANTFAAK